MAKFSIYSKNGSTIRYSGTPTYNGTYLKPAYIEFREIASDTPINWEVGDYVDYTRTGMRYKLYSIPQPTKNARQSQSGKAFVYQNVQLYAETKKLEIALFRDLVPLDNQIHFSTQQAISVYDNVAGIAERLQVCMDEYDNGNWVFDVISYEAADFGGNPLDFNDDYNIANYQQFITEDREFTMSNGTVLDALQQIYDTWEDIGWVHVIEGGVNHIKIGKTLYSTPDQETNIFRYGRGMGLKSIKKTQANKDEMATRLYVYGSNKNMYPNYYRGQQFLNAESTDIQNLMIPISRWGYTMNPTTHLREHDARKAYVQDDDAVSQLGLIPRSIYFDGGDNEEICPSIKNTTIGNVRDAKTALGETEYIPSAIIYPNNNERIDEIKVAVNPTDDGTQTAGGSQYLDVEKVAVTGQTIEVHFETDDDDVVSKSVSTGHMASYTMSDLPDSILTISEGIASGSLEVGVNVYANVSMIVEAGGKEIYRKVLLTGANNGTFQFSSPEIKKNVDEDSSISFYLELTARIRRTTAGRQGATLILSPKTQESGTATYSFYHNLPPSFSLTLKQIGFSIGDRAALGEGKTIHMLNGQCAGRSFRVKRVLYQSATDDWYLQMYRGYDEDLSLYFPNSIYPISAGDRFVILDIAMPELYIYMASEKLYNKGLEMLSKTARIEPYYEPDVDGKVMVENIASHPANETYVLREGKYFLLNDDEITGGNTDLILIDTLTINEGESAIPTYKVTLREKKKVSFQQSTANTIKTLEQKVVDASGTLKVVNTASTDYNDIDNKPSIDNVELIGNLDAEIDLGLARKDRAVLRSGTYVNNYLLACDGAGGSAKAVNPASISMGMAESIKDTTSQTGYKIAIVNASAPMTDPNTIYIVV